MWGLEPKLAALFKLTHYPSAGSGSGANKAKPMEPSLFWSQGKPWRPPDLSPIPRPQPQASLPSLEYWPNGWIPWVGDAVAFVIKMPGVEFNWDFLWLVLLVAAVSFSSE